MPKIPDENSQYPPNYWSFFSIVLKLFKFWGVLPVNIKFCRNRSPPVLIKFSVFGFISASFFFGFTLVHAIWGPAMMMNFEKSVLGDSFNSSNSTTKEHKKLGSSDGKISTISKSVYPIMGSSTPLTARFVSMFLLSKSISVLVRSFCLADNFLCLPSPYHLSNFGALLVLTGAGIAVHVPIIGLHFREVAPLNTYLGIIWEGFSMFNVLASFLTELQFVLLCYSVRYRFIYINNTLKRFVSCEFRSQDKLEWITGNCFQRKKCFRFWNKKTFTGEF